MLSYCSIFHSDFWNHIRDQQLSVKQALQEQKMDLDRVTKAFLEPWLKWGRVNI